MSSSNKTTTCSSPDKPSGNPPGIPFDKEPPSTRSPAKETPSGKPKNPVTKSMPKPTPKATPKAAPKATPKATPSGKPLGFVAFLKDFTRKNILALVENSAKLQLLKICQDCYHSMGATISPMNRNWGVSYFAKQLAQRAHKRFLIQQQKGHTIGDGCFFEWLEVQVHKGVEESQEDKGNFSSQCKKFGKLTKLQKKSGQWPQDFIKFNLKKILKQICPQCDSLQSAIEIKWINKELEHEHLIKMCQWENNSTAVKLKTRKPRKKPTEERQIACYCHNVHCMLETSTGGVYYSFCGYVKDGKDLPMDQTSTACKCEKLAIASAIDPLKEPDEEKAAVGGASVFLSYVKGKIDSCVNEQYLANPFATKANHLQNAHATAFLDIISDPVLGSARVETTLQEAMAPLQTTSKDGKKINQLRDHEETPNRNTNGSLEIGSYHKPIAIDGDTEDSKHHPQTLIHTPTRNQEPPKDETPAFIPRMFLTLWDPNSLKKMIQKWHGKEAAKSLSSVVKWCKRVQIHKQQKVQKEDD
eukprot:jgi/Psemu1/19356/gm1.19356_g